MSIVSFQPQPNFRMGLRFFDDMSMYIVKAVQSPNEKMVDWLLGCKMPARYIFLFLARLLVLFPSTCRFVGNPASLSHIANVFIKASQRLCILMNKRHRALLSDRREFSKPIYSQSLRRWLQGERTGVGAKISLTNTAMERSTYISFSSCWHLHLLSYFDSRNHSQDKRDLRRAEKYFSSHGLSVFV